MSNNPLNGKATGKPVIDIAERARRNTLSPAEREAEDLLAATRDEISLMLGQSIAALPIQVGKGASPHPMQCYAAADRITAKFSGAVLAAIEGEAATKELARIREGAPPDDVCRLVNAARLAVEEPDADAIKALDKAAEAFAGRVCWDDDGGSIPEAHATPCTCGSKEEA
jgi:hypothetical protein